MRPVVRKARNKERALNLIELILVVVIVTTLALIAIPNYAKSRKRVIAKEGFANTKLLAAAERIYRMDAGDYYDCTCTSSATCANAVSGCNSILKLMLNTNNWAYSVTTAGSPGSKTATVTATSAATGCTYTFQSASFGSEPTGSGCP